MLKLEIESLLTIEEKAYRISEHPAAPGIPYGQEGRAAVVYQVLDEAGSPWALKVFKEQYRVPSLVRVAERIAPYATLPGLRVCQRTVISATRHRSVLRQYPDLNYAVLMPWINGPTWFQLLWEKQELSPKQSLAQATSLAIILTSLEEQGLAHCDLSAANILLPYLTDSFEELSQSPIELVDVEQLYGPDLSRPDLLVSGSPGYAFPSEDGPQWGRESDRFAGAILIAEMLGWCDERVRNAAWGESYFDPAELQKAGSRYALLRNVLAERWGQSIAHLLDRIKKAEALPSCPTFGEWLAALPEEVLAIKSPQAVQPSTQQQSLQAGAEETIPVSQPENREVTPATLHGKPGDLIHLFDDAYAAYQAENWHKAVELLNAVVQKDTYFSHNGLFASELLTTAYRRSQMRLAPAPTPVVKDDLAQLFDEGYAAIKGKAWKQAEELLGIVFQRNPSYMRNGITVGYLIQKINFEKKKPVATALLFGVPISGIVIIAILCGLVSLYLFSIRPSPTPETIVETVIVVETISVEHTRLTTRIVTSTSPKPTTTPNYQATNSILATATMQAYKMATQQAMLATSRATRAKPTATPRPNPTPRINPTPASQIPSSPSGKTILIIENTSEVGVRVEMWMGSERFSSDSRPGSTFLFEINPGIYGWNLFANSCQYNQLDNFDLSSGTHYIYILPHEGTCGWTMSWR